MLHLAVLAIGLAITPLIAFVDVMPRLQVEVPQAACILPTCAVRENSMPHVVQSAVIETFAGKVLAADITAIVFPACAANHNFFRSLCNAIAVY